MNESLSFNLEGLIVLCVLYCSTFDFEEGCIEEKENVAGYLKSEHLEKNSFSLYTFAF